MRLPGQAPRLWNRGPARRFFLRHEPTMNPAPAAAYLLRMSVKRPTMWSQGTARRRLTRKRTRTQNPLPAALALAAPVLKKIGFLRGLGGILKTPSEKRAAAVAPQAIQSASAGNLTAARMIHDRTQFGIEKERAVWRAAEQAVPAWLMQEARTSPLVPQGAVDQSSPEAAVQTSIANAVYGKYRGPVGSPGYVPPPPSTGSQLLGVGQAVLRTAPAPRGRGGATRAARGTAASQALLGDPLDWTKAQRRKAGYTTARVKRWDPSTESTVSLWADDPRADQYMTVAQGKALRKRQAKLMTAAQRAGSTALPAAAAAGRAGLSKIGGGSAAVGLARAGVVIGGLAAGYYIGTQLNHYLAGRALEHEQAGVQAALAFRDARAQAAAAKGAPLTAAEVRSMGDVYKRQLVALGYDPVTFARRRSTVERFFTGEEE